MLIVDERKDQKAKADCEAMRGAVLEPTGIILEPAAAVAFL